MPRGLTLLVLVALVPCGACAGPHPPYWTAERDGKRSVLLGTMHAEVDIAALAPELDGELKSARVLVTEADVRNVDPTDFDVRIALPAGQSVRTSVSDDDWQTISAALVGIVNLGVAEHQQPWFLEGQAVGKRLPPVAPIDATLVQRAADDGVRLDFFETWQDQVDELNAVGFDDGLQTLLQTARDPQAAVAEHLTWGKAYAHGDVDEMTKLAFDPAAMKARPAYYDDVVFRHEHWVAHLEDQLADGNAFVAVGFMHMLTARGLPAVLAKDGFTVELH